jgi:hypothetical protein
MELTLVNPDPKYQRVGLMEPAPAGYLHLAAVIEPTIGRTPFPRGGPRKTALLAELKALAVGLERHEAVTKATVYRAVLIPPTGSDAQRMATRPARYDVAVLGDGVGAGPRWDRRGQVRPARRRVQQR